MPRRPAEGEWQEFADDGRVHADPPGSSRSGQGAQHRRAGFFITEHAFKLSQ
jgi:hypothetical protein